MTHNLPRHAATGYTGLIRFKSSFLGKMNLARLFLQIFPGKGHIFMGLSSSYDR